MLLRGIGLEFTLSHFPVLGGLMGFVGSCAISSLNKLLSSKSSWLLTFFDFFCFNSNLINCPLVSFLRSFFSISILYGVVFKFLFFLYLYYMVLSLSPFWVESLYGHPYPYPYYMVLSLSPFWVELLYWSTTFPTNGWHSYWNKLCPIIG